jgi:hypothetical protein
VCSDYSISIEVSVLASIELDSTDHGRLGCGHASVSCKDFTNRLRQPRPMARRTGELDELAAVLSDRKAYAVDFDFVSAGAACCGRVSRGDAIAAGLMSDKIHKLCPLLLVSFLKLLSSGLLDGLRAVLAFFLVDGRVDQLEVTIRL